MTRARLARTTSSVSGGAITSGAGERRSQTEALPGALSAGFGELTEELVLAASGHSSPERVVKFSWCNKALQRIRGLVRCTGLLELDLTNNNISDLSGLAELTALRRLVLTRNRVSHVDGVRSLASLEHLLLQGNMIHSIDALHFGQLPALRTLYLQNSDKSQANPVCRLPGYKRALLEMLPQLTNLDGERNPRQPLTTNRKSQDIQGNKPTCIGAAAMPNFAFPAPESWFEENHFHLPEAQINSAALSQLQQHLQSSAKAVASLEAELTALLGYFDRRATEPVLQQSIQTSDAVEGPQ